VNDNQVDETARVDPGAEVGAGTRIWHFSHVMAGARIGRGCMLGQNVFVAAGAIVGDGVKIQNNVSIYEGVTLEDGVFCGPSTVFTNVVTPRSHVSRRRAFARTIVRQGATIGANSTLLCGLEIGRFAFIGAGAVVTRDVPAFALVVGNPARHVGWACACGVRLGARRATDARDGVARPLACEACGAGYTLEAGGTALTPLGEPVARVEAMP
jgi:UDP-2-acetamido-3-amino-2,3-dideoxy-glucuronate N-acetyltransferase